MNIPKRVAFIGASNTGKSLILSKCTNKKHIYPTIGAEIFNFETFDVIDCSGNDRFHNICSEIYRNNIDLTVFFFRVDVPSSFGRMKRYLEEFIKLYDGNMRGIIIGTGTSTNEPTFNIPIEYTLINPFSKMNAIDLLNRIESMI